MVSDGNAYTHILILTERNTCRKSPQISQKKVAGREYRIPLPFSLSAVSNQSVADKNTANRHKTLLLTTDY